MKYRVVVQPTARMEAAEVFTYLWERSPQAAERWLDGFHRAAASLDSMPERCGLAPEDPQFSQEIRQLLYARHRILFTITGRTVRVIHVRHSARRMLDPSDEE